MHARKEVVDIPLGTPSKSGPVSLPPTALPKRSGFSELDEALIAAVSAEVEPAEALRERIVFVRAPRIALEHLADHAVRRLGARARLEGRAPVIPVASSARVDEPWSEIARYIGVPAAVAAAAVSSAPLSPRAVSERIFSALANGECDGLVVVDPMLSSFGKAVVAQFGDLAVDEAACEGAPALLEDASSGASDQRDVAGVPAARPTSKLFVLMASDVTQDGAVELPASRVIDVDAHLAPSDVRTWWETAARDFDRLPQLDRLDSLSTWWRAASATPADSVVPSVLVSSSAAQLHRRLVMAGRAWPLAALGQLGARESHVKELGALGLVEIHGGQVHGELVSLSMLTPPFEPSEMCPADSLEDTRVVARGLDEVFSADPWATLRAAELFASLPQREGESDRDQIVEAMAMRAIASVVEAETREDLWRRYCALVVGTFGQDASGRDGVAPTVNVASCLRTADLALRIGDVDRAVEFAQRAASIEAESSEVLLMLGRATAATGDLTTASITITKAMQRSESSSPNWASAAVELAEVRYITGELADAERLATEAEQVAARVAAVPARLAARNVLGKVLLAKAAYTDAEIHFAEDACDAACAGESVAELRARLNRAIALMSSGRYDEAKAMLESVLQLGERRGEVKAVCFALGNLAIISIYMHRYAEALSLLDRTIDIVRRTGDKRRLALHITNLAELRLRLGLDREAEQLLLFGRRICAFTSPRFAKFSLVSGRIHLAHGQTAAAMRAIGTAMAGSGLSLSDDKLPPRDDRGWAGIFGDQVLECLRVAARVVLEDGDTKRAAEFLDRASNENGTARAKAEVKTLRAACARAAGEPFGELAEEALYAARQSDDEELMREAHQLLHFAAVNEGDDRSAQLHLDSAIALRDQVAESLPEWIKTRYLARRELRELARLEASRAASLVERAAWREQLSEVAPVSRWRAGDAASDRRIVGADGAVKSLLAAIQKVGRSETTVLIHGESGTGKELVAEALHEASGRSSGPLVKVNCAALVETLLLSELFGHEKGSFTGAAARRRGRFEAADGGTLFLDEIGDISPRTQVALLRVLQEKTFERVGGTAPIRSDVRVVCATHRDLKTLVAKGGFREDLYYRLCGVVLEVPALRARLGDLGTVADALLRRIAGERGGAPKSLSPAALFALKQHGWPGNIRELENALRAASLFADGAQLELDDFTENVESLRYLSASVMSVGGIDLGMAPAASESVANRSSTIARDLLDGAARRPSSPPSTIRSLDGRSLDGRSVDGRSVDSSSIDSVGPPSSPTDVAYAHVRSGVSLSDMKKQIERECIARALGETDGNITRAATLLGMKRPRLSQLVKQYGLGGDGEQWADGEEMDDDKEEA